MKFMRASLWAVSLCLLVPVSGFSQTGFGIGTTSPTEKLDVAGGVRVGNTTNTNDGTIRWTGTDFEGRKSGAWVSLTGGSISGSGTTNYISKWTSASSQGNSLLYDNGINVGIGSASPTYTLDVVSTLENFQTLRIKAPGSPLIKWSGSYNSGNGAEFWQDATGNIRININATTNAIYASATAGNNIGIGTLNPEAKLHVVGQVKITGGTPGVNKVLTSDAVGLASWVDPNTLVNGGGTLDQAYDFGGAGVGRTITADAGAVRILGVDGFVSTGTYGSGAIPATGAGSRMMWYPGKSAFRVGYINGAHWDDANIGAYSFATGISTYAQGYAAFAAGSSTQAHGNNSISLGSNSTASGTNAITIGSSCLTQNGSTSSTAIGYGNQTFGNFATSMGYFNFANSFAEFVVGAYNTNLTGSTTGWVASDRLFTVGNGTSSAARSDAFVILKNGNTGIGTAGPRAKLQIYEPDESASQANFTGSLNDAGILITTDYVHQTYTPGIFWSTHTIGATMPKAGIYSYQSNTGSSLIFGTSNLYTSGLTNNHALVLDPNGRVGIGTLTPVGTLQIMNTLTDEKLVISGGSLDGTLYQRLSLYVDDTYGVLFEAPAPGNITANRYNYRFGWRGGGTGIYIQGADGNVGIGTTTTTAKLQVNGQARATNGYLVGAANSGTRIETGVIDVTSDGDKVVTFTTAFTTPPVVTFGGSYDTGQTESFATMTQAGRPTTTGFTVRLVNHAAAWSRGKIYWTAIGN